ncbi:oxygen-independent coproporphyrinogen-3 oxidase [Clostridium acetobutylicum]|uniref:Heme chaperone HemW n=1 Tax=Clostridium acetobutylicum (strain ATCC 824 / DSM 792 / JCM 1419 / IAM 19013 / LMG 5710 / NBRC 13948 / NRRL B-527 / VKM B-1787 / 2291 / W) TaxID=272562 RepID=Q97JJ5_CLOAB|nr:MULTISPECIES: radical SAM family heme chaperone HemW [Clostridium]AAK79250.1 Coproporphyrinogen III oxidase [Clostridium acetobutylicum ATCC 824]ADZ20329.1 coproporphyrinogen III oxidase [Clostridium acetobutylicum EA 2018]AEI33226.1 coproporphyrinogen III oxidase [Clostridium acetobutylicum DSM 1731]AWV81503.1 oxygen-independent coproporphyrinogen III oxidase [Clostridium acetobutylicum]MBC2393140.1 oxygen-independent coproporphyrinogen III oxidase [Clostridium acetobutylicum]
MNKLGLYIHIPFCKSKCLYCDFPSYACIEDYMIPYAKALCTEIEKASINKVFSSIFIGGGTPSFLSIEALNILCDALKKVRKTKDVEFTVEGNPNSFTEKKLMVFKDMGVNRLSIGLQACQDRLLKKLGRIHTLKEFTVAFKRARNLGFNNINVDLMFGIPDQTLEDFKESLEFITKLKPEHISSYSLIVEEGTPYFKMNEGGKLKLPNEDEERDMYSFARTFLEEKGYNQYEISNFAVKDKECRHNLIYWELDNYIGCGASAHSYFNGVRYRNINNVKKYIEQISKGNSVVEENHRNLLKEDMEEFMFLGLRKTRGVSIEEFKLKFNKDIQEVYGDVIKKYETIGMIILNEHRVFLTERGMQISNSIMCDFLL